MKFKKLLFLTTLALTISLPLYSYAATKIKSVGVKIEVDDEDYEGSPELTITTKSDRYSFDEYTITNDLVEITEDDDSGNGPGSSTDDEKTKTTHNPSKPFTCEITLSAEDGYTFDSFKKSDIKVSGFDASCTKASRKDSGKTLVLTVELPGIKSLVGPVEEAIWNEDGKAEWSAAKNASTYTLRLYNDGKIRGSFETGGTTFDFRPAMLKEGSYHYTVKPNGDSENKVERTESSAIMVTKEQAIQNREDYSIEYEKDETVEGPSSKSTALNLGWQKDGEHYYYRQENGIYIQTNWLKDGNDWYFFDENGHMVTSDWAKWSGDYYYFGNDGKMWKNKSTPDGHKVNKEGIRIN